MASDQANSALSEWRNPASGTCRTRNDSNGVLCSAAGPTRSGFAWLAFGIKGGWRNGTATTQEEAERLADDASRALGWRLP